MDAEQFPPIYIRGDAFRRTLPLGCPTCCRDLPHIDLSRYLNNVKIDPKQSLALVSGGALGGTWDKAAIEHFHSCGPLTLRRE